MPNNALAELPALYRRTLLEDVLPFWERHALAADGGINTCLADDGTLLSTDRWCWSQWRAVWVYSRLYNHIERRPAWLETARRICSFMRKVGPLPDGRWPMVVSPAGQVLRGAESIFTDGFAIYGLVELYRATHEIGLLDLALRTFEAVEHTLAEPGLPPMAPYPPAPAGAGMAHGVSMIFSQVDHELARASGHARVKAAAERYHRRVMETHLQAARGLVFEWLGPRGETLPPPGGTAVLPGHAIESMWFQMAIARDRGDKFTLDRAVEVIRRNLEIGWDAEHGGLFYAVDAEGRSEVGWPFADTKLWWPHTEALYGTLAAWEHCRQDWCLEWHERIREYSYRVFPVAEHGEWRQKCDRQGRPMTQVVALPVKDPFHLPRALILSIELLTRVAGSPQAS